MKNVICKKSAGDSGISTMAFSVVTLFMMVVIMLYSFNEVELTFLRTAFSDGVDIVCLSTIVPDMEQVAEDVKNSVTFDPNNGFTLGGDYEGTDFNVDIKIDTDASYERFLDLLQTNLVEVVDNVDVTNVVVEELVLYCIKGEDVEEYIYDKEGNCNLIVHQNQKGTYTSPNGVNVENTSVYVRLSFTYKDVFGITHRGLTSENYKAVRIK